MYRGLMLFALLSGCFPSYRPHEPRRDLILVDVSVGGGDSAIESARWNEEGLILFLAPDGTREILFNGHSGGASMGFIDELPADTGGN
jgi:hypothetical protein